MDEMAIDDPRPHVVLPPGQDELPSSDGEPMDTPRHRRQMNLLIDSLERAWSARDDFFVGGNMFVYYSELQTRVNDFRGPDVFVVLGVDRGRRRKSWVLWEEGTMPNVVIELLSPSTESVDRGEKMRIYSRLWRTAEYYLYDPEDHRLEGYALDPIRGAYERIAPDARGDVAVRQLGLSLGVRDDDAVRGEPPPWLRWIDASGAPLPVDLEAARREEERAEAARARADAERARAEAERARAESAERRLAELEAELAKRRR